MKQSAYTESRHRGSRDVPWVVRLTHQLESSEQLDHLDPGLWPVARALVSAPWLRDALQGRWLGHALHPLLTDLPIGAWTSATVLDFIGGTDARRSAERLLAVGVVGALPTAVTGLAEWAETSGRERRVGLVHAVANVVALGLYTSSLATRRRGRHAAGVALSLAGGAVAGLGGYLGSHLSLGRKVATRHPAVADPPTRRAMTAEDIDEGSHSEQELDIEKSRPTQALGAGVRTSLRDNASAYGFSVSITAAFGLVSSAHPQAAEPLQIILFAAGAALAFLLIELVASHRFKRAGNREGDRVLLISGAVDVLSVGAAVGSAVLLAQVPGMLVWPLTSFGVTFVYLLVGGVDILVARQVARRS